MEPYFYFIMGAVVLTVIVVVLIYAIIHIKSTNEMTNQIKETLNEYGKLTINKPYSSYDYHGEQYHVLILRVSRPYKFTFNSKIVWEKSHKQQKQFINQTAFSQLEGNKMVVIFPNEGPYRYHYDESEIRFIKSGDLVWDFHVIGYQDLEDVLSTGLKS